MNIVAEQFSKLAGDAIARKYDRDMKAKAELLILEFELLNLELELFLAGGPVPGRSKGPIFDEANE